MSMQTKSTRDAQVELTVQVSARSDESVTLSYALTNHSSHDVFVFNKLYRGIGDGMVFLTEPNLAYVECLNKTIEISKKAMRPPNDVDVEALVVPVTTRVQHDTACTETFTLSLPLQLYSEYGPSTQSTSTIEITKDVPVEFTLGYVVLDLSTAGDFVREVKTKHGPGYVFAVAIPAGHRTIRVSGLSF